MPTLWCLLSLTDLDAAIGALAFREGTSCHNIGRVTVARRTGEGTVESSIHSWVAAAGLASAIWTNLPPKWDGIAGRAPSVDEVVQYCVTNSSNALVREYVQRAPQQIRTEYRNAIESRLGWRQMTQR